jgi:hypothetical protein
MYLSRNLPILQNKPPTPKTVTQPTDAQLNTLLCQTLFLIIIGYQVLPMQSKSKATVEAKLSKQKSTESKKWQWRLWRRPLAGKGMATPTPSAVAVADVAKAMAKAIARQQLRWWRRRRQRQLAEATTEVTAKATVESKEEATTMKAVLTAKADDGNGSDGCGNRSINHKNHQQWWRQGEWGQHAATAAARMTGRARAGAM